MGVIKRQNGPLYDPGNWELEGRVLKQQGGASFSPSNWEADGEVPLMVWAFIAGCLK